MASRQGDVRANSAELLSRDRYFAINKKRPAVSRSFVLIELPSFAN